MATIQIRRPTAPPAPEVSAPTYRFGGPVPGAIVGLRTDQAWRSWRLIAALWGEWLAEAGAKTVEVETKAQTGAIGDQDRSEIEAMAQTADFAIVGLGTCGSCTSYTIADAIAIEQQSKPVIAVVTEEFETHGHNMARHLGHADLKVLVLPYPLEARPEAELREIAKEYFPKALEMLGVEQ